MVICPGIRTSTVSFLRAQPLEADSPGSNPSPLLTSCVTSGKRLTLAVPQFPSLKSEDNDSPCCVGSLARVKQTVSVKCSAMSAHSLQGLPGGTSPPSPSSPGSPSRTLVASTPGLSAPCRSLLDQLCLLGQTFSCRDGGYEGGSEVLLLVVVTVSSLRCH